MYNNNLLIENKNDLLYLRTPSTLIECIKCYNIDSNRFVLYCAIFVNILY